MKPDSNNTVMNSPLLKFLAGLAALGSTLGILDLSKVTNLLPPGWALPVALIPAIGAALVHFALAWGDYLDDGQKNDSFLRCAAWAVLGALVLALSSCQVPLSISLADARSGISGTYSSKGGVGLSYSRPIHATK
jgi:hypothetical protein